MIKAPVMESWSYKPQFGLTVEIVTNLIVPKNSPLMIIKKQGTNYVINDANDKRSR